jgi:hypothetical protein
VEALLPPGCPPRTLRRLTNCIWSVAQIRAADSAPRSRAKRIEAAAAELRRAIPERLALFETAVADMSTDDELRPARRAEAERLRRLLTAAQPCHLPPPDLPPLKAHRVDPEMLAVLFDIYREGFPVGPTGRPTGISRDGPAVRFLCDAIKLIGWRQMEPSSIERTLRKALAPATQIN